MPIFYYVKHNTYVSHSKKYNNKTPASLLEGAGV